MIGIGDTVDAVKQDSTHSLYSRKEVRNFLIKSTKYSDSIELSLPFIVKRIDVCDFRNNNGNCHLCPGEINGMCFGYNNFLIETIRTKEWNTEDNR